MQATQWLDKVGGVIKSPVTPTCKSQRGGRIIDYIVIDKRISAAVSIWTDLSFPGSPHSPVILRMNTIESRKLALFLIRPSLMPLDQPLGCSAQPPAVVAVPALSAAKADIAQLQSESRGSMDAAFTEVMQYLEKEWCQLACLPVGNSTCSPHGPTFNRIRLFQGCRSMESAELTMSGLGCASSPTAGWRWPESYADAAPLGCYQRQRRTGGMP